MRISQAIQRRTAEHGRGTGNGVNTERETGSSLNSLTIEVENDENLLRWLARCATEPNYYPSGVHWTYGYDPRNRLISTDDPAGNLNSLGHTVSITYDQASNKKSVQRANNQVITY